MCTARCLLSRVRLGQSALLLLLDSAQSAAADRRFRHHSADLLPRAGPGAPLRPIKTHDHQVFDHWNTGVLKQSGDFLALGRPPGRMLGVNTRLKWQEQAAIHDGFRRDGC